MICLGYTNLIDLVINRQVPAPVISIVRLLFCLAIANCFGLISVRTNIQNDAQYPKVYIPTAPHWSYIPSKSLERIDSSSLKWIRPLYIFGE